VLDVRRLRVLSEVARRGSLAAAADVLSYTPSAVSQQIAALEREAGAVLLERRARGVVLTEAGQTLVEHTEVILAELAGAESALRELADLRRGRLRLASFATAGATVLPRAMRVFGARHPEIELSVAQASPDESVAGLREGRLDLALTVDLDDDPADVIEVVHLFDDPVQLALNRDHPLATAPEVRLEQLAAETWIDVPRMRSGGRVLLRACERAGFVPRVAFESDDYTVIQSLVGVGAGLALLPDLALCPPHEAVVLRSLGPGGPRRRIQAATRGEPYRAPSATAMLEVLLDLGRPDGAQLAAAAPPNPAPPPSRYAGA
jgi:DNA-binding transcriptional LysR family regulator